MCLYGQLKSLELVIWWCVWPGLWGFLAVQARLSEGSRHESSSKTRRLWNFTAVASLPCWLTFSHVIFALCNTTNLAQQRKSITDAGWRKLSLSEESWCPCTPIGKRVLEFNLNPGDKVILFVCLYVTWQIHNNCTMAALVGLIHPLLSVFLDHSTVYIWPLSSADTTVPSRTCLYPPPSAPVHMVVRH